MAYLQTYADDVAGNVEFDFGTSGVSVRDITLTALVDNLVLI